MICSCNLSLLFFLNPVLIVIMLGGCKSRDALRSTVSSAENKELEWEYAKNPRSFMR